MSSGPALSVDDDHRRRLELIATAVLAIATVLTAWSAFQATKWSGVMALELSSAAAARTSSVAASDLANSQTTIDVTLFAQYAAAVAEESEELATFFQERFREEFRPAFDAWQRTDPLQNPAAPSSPFVMDEYQLVAGATAAGLAAEADQAAADARTANQRGDNYVLTSVFFASVLFFAGVGSKASRLVIQRSMVGASGALLVVGALILSTFPIEV